MMTTTFYFNTGVTGVVARGHNPIKLSKGQIWMGTMQIPFDCDDVPAKSQFLFACDNPELRDSKYQSVIVREIHNSTLRSKYAYFRIPTHE